MTQHMDAYSLWARLVQYPVLQIPLSKRMWQSFSRVSVSFTITNPTSYEIQISHGDGGGHP